MGVDKRYLYLFMIKRTLDQRKFVNLSKLERITNLLLILENGLFPEVQNFMSANDDLENDEQDDRYYGLGAPKSDHRLTQIFKKNNDRYIESMDIIHKLELDLNEGYEKSYVKKRLDYLKGIFSLSDLDIDAILSLVLLKQFKETTIKSLSTLDDFYIDKTRLGERLYQEEILLSFMGEELGSESLAFEENSTLMTAGLIQSAYFDRFHIGEQLYKYLMSDETNLSYLHSLEMKLGPVYELNSFSIPKEKVELLKKIISSGKAINVLIHGLPGTGKTEFVRALGASLQREVLFVPTTMPGRDGGLDKRKLSLNVASLTTNPQRQLVCIDEGDDLLVTRFDFFSAIRGEGGQNKEFMNNLLDSSKAALIFITNNLAADESTLRRFSMILEFKEMSKEHRKEMIINTFKAKDGLNILCDEVIDKLAKSESLSQGHIALAVKDSIACSNDPAVQKEVLMGLIEERLDFLCDKRKRKKISLVQQKG